MAELASPPSSSTSKYTKEEIYSYTLRADATCLCFVRDVLQMHDADVGTRDFQVWWLGTTPCRAVQIVGLLVGVTEYEKRTIYTIDDGTAVIDCVHLRQIVRPPTKSKQNVKKATSNGKESARIETEAYYLPSPTYSIGATLRVSGKIRVYRDDDKQILIDDIATCRIYEEPRHWIEVRRLHNTKYTQPFTIPAVTTVPSTPAPRLTDNQAISTPQTHSTVPSSSSPVRTSSPDKSSSNHSTRLKHPTRLHSKDLTANTFRIYLKHYMDALCRDQHSSKSVSRNSSQEDVFVDQSTTPPNRPARSPNRTPRPLSKRPESNKHSSLRGISLSYLRRVDDLRVLARRVVVAEGKRREREARRKEKEVRTKEKERASQSSKVQSFSMSTRLSPKQASKSMTTSKPAPSTEPTSAKVKRLFLWTIRTLLDDGSIIICDGPSLPLPSLISDRSLHCWRDVTNTTTNSVSFDTSTLSKASTLSTQDIANEDSDDDSPSDPDLEVEEECYLPLSNEVLAQPLLNVIRNIVGPGAGLRGATISEMLSRLKKDDRWKRLGDWHVQDALEHLDDADKVWKVSKDRWGLVKC